jgi:hypothetical protein
MYLYEVLENPDEDDTLAVTISLENTGLANGGLLNATGERIAGHIMSCAYDLEENDNLASLIARLVRTVWGKDALRALVSLPTSPKYEDKD